MATPDRRPRWAFVAIALGVVVAVFALIDPNSGDGLRVDTGVDEPDTSRPTVLGAVVTREAEAPPASAADPATFDLGSTTVSAARTSTTRAGATPPPTLAPARTIDNTTTTTVAPTSTSTSSTTSTTVDSTTTSTTVE